MSRKRINIKRTNMYISVDRTGLYHLVQGCQVVAKWTDGLEMHNLVHKLGWEEKIHGRILKMYRKYALKPKEV